jgi:Flp pilus assembly pilin Flp
MIVSSFACRLKGLARRASAEETGQALVEYSLLLALIAVVAFGAVNEFGLGVSSLYSQIASGVKAGMP